MALTPQDPQRHAAGAPDTTRPASTARLPQRTPTHAVQGPARLENSHAGTRTPAGPPPLHGATAQDCCPREQK